MAQPTHAANTVVRVYDPATSSSNVFGDLYSTFNVSIRIENVVDMAGYEFRLYWNTSILNCTQWNYTSKAFVTDPSTPPWTNYFTAVKNVTVLNNGKTRFWLSVNYGMFEPKTGTYVIATLNFKVVGIGSTVLSLPEAESVVGDYFGNTIPINIISCSFTTISHDVAIVKVEPQTQFVIRGASVGIDVDVQNKGNVLQSFTVTAYYNSSAGLVGSIGTQDVLNLAGGASQDLLFLWNTLGVADGSFVIFANATIVTGETSTADNQLIDSTVEIQSQFKHDVTISSFATSNTILAEGEIAALKIDVKNQGWGDEANLVLGVYYNSTTLATMSIPLIHPGSSLKYFFNFSTADKSGRYDLVANVSLADDVNNTNNEKTLQLFVTQAPVASFTISSNEATVLQEVTFDASASTDPDGSIAKCIWDFGDSFYLGNGSIAKHVYTKEGNYTVTLTLTDSRGLTYSTNRSLTYSCRTQKGFTVKVAPPSMITQDAIYYAAIATIMIEALALAYLVIKRKPKPAA